MDGDVESNFGCSRLAAAWTAQPTGMLQPRYIDAPVMSLVAKRGAVRAYQYNEFNTSVTAVRLRAVERSPDQTRGCPATLREFVGGTPAQLS